MRIVHLSSSLLTVPRQFCCDLCSCFLFVLSTSLLYSSLMSLVDASWIATLLGKSCHLAVHVGCNIFVMFCVVLSFPSRVFSGIFNLIVQSLCLLFFT